MYGVFAPLAIAALGLGYWRSRAPTEIRLLRTKDIAAPAEVTFGVVSRTDRLPSWHRLPRWLPRPMQVTVLSRWGDFIPQKQPATGRALEKIRIRSLPAREFGYSCTARRSLCYEFIFRLIPIGRGCRLTWELHYHVRRAADRVWNYWSLQDDVQTSMEQSLESIRRLAEALAAQAAWQEPGAREDLGPYPLRAGANAGQVFRRWQPR